MKTVIYNPATLRYEVLPSVADRKAALIHDISIIQNHLGKGCVDANQFEALMELSIDELTNIINDQSAALARAKSINP